MDHRAQLNLLNTGSPDRAAPRHSISPHASQKRPMSPVFYQLKYPFPVPDELPAIAAGLAYAIDIDGSYLADVDGSLLVIPG